MEREGGISPSIISFVFGVENLCMRVFFSSGCNAVELPIASCNSVMVNARSLYNSVSSGLRGATWSLIPGIKISPLGLTREFIKKIRSVMGS